MPLWPILKKNRRHLHKECLYGRLRLKTEEKEEKTYEGFPAAIVATTGHPQNLFNYNFEVELTIGRIEFFSLRKKPNIFAGFNNPSL